MSEEYPDCFDSLFSSRDIQCLQKAWNQKLKMAEQCRPKETDGAGLEKNLSNNNNTANRLQGIKDLKIPKLNQILNLSSNNRSDNAAVDKI